MEGLDGAFDVHFTPTTAPSDLASISTALQATLDPHTAPAIRQQALAHLEHVKQQPSAPSHGFTLADDWRQPAAVRYYGLQLLEHAVRFRWDECRAEQREQLRVWAKRLAGSMRAVDAPFVRGKIAQLWVELAKRCWGGEWMEMDRLLVRLWTPEAGEKEAVNAVFVLAVLEMLSEDVCGGEDARADVLGGALNEIMIPPGLMREHVQTRGSRAEVRAGEEGWLVRMCAFFATCVREGRVRSGAAAEELQTCALKALNAMRPTMAWISLKAVVEADCIDCLLLAFHTNDIALQTAATEVLYALLVRPYNAHFHNPWLELVHQAMRPDHIALIKHAYSSADSQPGEDSAKYVLQKKISEVLSLLADALASQPGLAKMKVDIASFFALLIQVLESQSLVVSIPVLHSWTKLLLTHDSTLAGMVTRAIAILLQVCSDRLFRYEALPEDSREATMQFLYEDFEAIPERHAFVGNYRRYCVRSVESITRSRPLEALAHLLDRMMSTLQDGPYTLQRGFDMSSYRKSAPAVLRFDAHFQVVTSGLKGFTYWVTDTDALSADDPVRLQSEKERDAVVEMLQNFLQRLASAPVDDPEVAVLQLQLLVMVTRTLKPSSQFVLSIVEHILNLRLDDDAAYKQYSDGVKEFEGTRVLELQKLALGFPNELFQVYGELEPRIATLAEVHVDDSRLVWGYRAFLFIVAHRADGVYKAERREKLRSMITPVYEGWHNNAVKSPVGDFWTFLDSLGLGQLPQFFQAHRFDKVRDWSLQELDEAGKAQQKAIETKAAALPLRMTKAMLAATTERLREATDEHDTACALWSDVIPVILPTLLPMIRHATAFNNMANWSQLPEELQMVVKRTLQDRFWQAGISNESKDDFYARISSSRASYEGFASTVRGTPRAIREQGYHLLYLMTKFEQQFYSLPDFAEPLADALFADAECLSTNQLHGLLNLSQQLVARCPPQYHARFLPPLLIRLFEKFDARISGEWDAIALQQQEQTAEDEALSDEMRTESVLRQLTYATVTFVPLLLEPSAAAADMDHPSQRSKALSDLVLSDEAILEPLILFCSRALRMRDSRCCTVICRVFRTLIPRFTGDSAVSGGVRAFIARDVLQGAISSLNEPYFADLQRDLAALIALIVALYAPRSPLVRGVLLSLPHMSAARVDAAVLRVCAGRSERGQRAVVMDLLDGVRGVGIHEAGRIVAPPLLGGRRKERVGRVYLEVERKNGIVEGEEVGLDGVAGMFGDV